MHARGYKRIWNFEKYSHRRLQYKAHSITLSFESGLLNRLFKPIIAKSAMYVDLGSRQACKNTAVLKLHYGESESLYFRIQATTCKARRNIEKKIPLWGLDLVWQKVSGSHLFMHWVLSWVGFLLTWFTFLSDVLPLLWTSIASNNISFDVNYTNHLNVENYVKFVYILNN